MHHHRATGRLAAVAVMGALAAVPAAPARAGLGSVTWNFDIQSSGGNVAWTSPTSVDPGAPLYQAAQHITLVEVDVTFLGIPFNNINVTNQLPPEFLDGGGLIAGPTPITILNQPVQYPDPPAAICVAANVSISVDASGFGHTQLTNVTLGQCQVDLGFGLVTVVLHSIRVVGEITVTAIPCPWDLDGDNTVAVTDLLGVLELWGTDPGGPPDVDADGVVGVTDFLGVLAHWGPCPV